MEVKKDNSNVGGSSAAKHSSALTPHLTPSYNSPFNSYRKKESAARRMETVSKFQFTRPRRVETMSKFQFTRPRRVETWSKFQFTRPRSLGSRVNNNLVGLRPQNLTKSE